LLDILIVVGGVAYLLNKIFFWAFERSREEKPFAWAWLTRFVRGLEPVDWHIASWSIYLVGLLPWVIVFLSRRNYIAALLEAGAGPSMVAGLLNDLREKSGRPKKKAEKWLDWFAWICIATGLTYSLHDFGGLTALSQYLELGLVAGFLVGTALLAIKHPSGYLCYVLMHVFCAWLMYTQGTYWMVWQQAISLIFIVDSFRLAHRRSSSAPS